MKLVELAAVRRNMVEFTKEEIDFMTHFAKQNKYGLKLEPPSNAEFSRDQEEGYVTINISREESDTEGKGMFHYRAGSSLTTDEKGTVPLHRESITKAFTEEEKLKYLDRTLTGVVK